MTDATDLEDVLDQFLAEYEMPDRAALADYLARYPHYANDLVAFAAARADQAAARAPASLSPARESALVDAALAYGTRFDAAHGDAATPVAAPTLGQLALRAGATLGQLAETVGLDGFITAKLDKRLIRRETIPRRLLQGLADRLATSVEIVMDALDGPPRVATGPAFMAIRSVGRPTVESFADAITASSLTDAAKARWLADLD